MSKIGQKRKKDLLLKKANKTIKIYNKWLNQFD